MKKLLVCFCLFAGLAFSLEDSLSSDRVNGFFDFVNANRKRLNGSPNARDIEAQLDQALKSWGEAFLAFSRPRSIDRTKAISAAKTSTPSVVWVVYEAFENLLNNQRQAVDLVGEIVHLASTEEAFAVYLLNQHHFETYIALLEKIVGEDDWKRMCRANYGVDANLGMGWLREHIGGRLSVVPFAYNEKNMKGKTLHLSIPYGQRVDIESPISGDFAVTPTVGLSPTSKQRDVILVDGRLVESSGIYMEHSSGNFMKFIAQHGAPSFASERVTMRQQMDSPFVVWYKQCCLKEGKSEEEINNILKTGVFFPFPDSPFEEMLFQATLLEAMEEIERESQSTGFTPSLRFISGISEVEEDVMSAPVELPPPLSFFQEAANSFWEECVRLEWEQRQKAVSEGCVTGKLKQPQPKKGKKINVSPQNSEPKVAEVFVPSQSNIEDVRQKGRVKYRHLGRLVADAFRSKGEGVRVKVLKDGSHIKIHIESGGTGAGVTLLRFHGSGDRTTSAKEALAFVSQIQRLLT